MNLKIYEKTKYNNIYKHKANGTYAIDLSLGYDALGKRIRTTKTGILSEKEARLLLTNEDIKRNCKNVITNMSKFEDCLNEYYDWCILSNTAKEETIKKKKCRFNNHILPFFKGKRLEKINENEILNWHRELDNKNLSIQTKHTLHKQLSAYFNYLIIHKHVLVINPCLPVKNYKIPKKQIEYRTVDEIYKLLDTIKNDKYKSEEIKLRIYAIVMLCFFCGFRIGELLAIKLKDFDFDINKHDYIDVDTIKLTIDKTIYYSSNGYILSDGKTEESLGTIFIGKKVFESVFNYIKYMNKLGYLYDNDDYIFCNPESKKDINVYSLEYLRKQFNYFVDAAGLDHTRFKDMRSSHGTFLLSNGYSLEEVQSRLRHSKKETTEKYYATFYEENKKELAQNIDKLITKN